MYLYSVQEGTSFSTDIPPLLIAAGVVLCRIVCNFSRRLSRSVYWACGYWLVQLHCFLHFQLFRRCSSNSIVGPLTGVNHNCPSLKPVNHLRKQKKVVALYNLVLQENRPCMHIIFSWARLPFPFFPTSFSLGCCPFLAMKKLIVLCNF